MGMLVWALLGVALAGGDGEEISRSRGKKGGIVVLWPRVVGPPDATADALAGQLQQRLSAAATRVGGERSIDVRPPPERVCSQLGCRAVSVGLMLGHQGGGCAVVAWVAAPGASSQQLVPLVGTVQLASSQAAFRQAPEQLVNVSEMVPCTDVIGSLDLLPLEEALGQALAAAP